MNYYKLDDNGNPVRELGFIKYWRWFETADRTVEKTQVTPDVIVSTVFLGLDHNLKGNGPPVLWETMIFGGPHDDYQKRYTSLADAKEGHRRAVELASQFQ